MTKDHRCYYTTHREGNMSIYTDKRKHISYNPRWYPIRMQGNANYKQRSPGRNKKQKIFIAVSIDQRSYKIGPANDAKNAIPVSLKSINFFTLATATYVCKCKQDD